MRQIFGLVILSGCSDLKCTPRRSYSGFLRAHSGSTEKNKPLADLGMIEVIAAVLSGNALTGAYLYFLWHAFRVREFSELKLPVIAAGVIPPLVMALGGYLAKSAG